MISFQTELAKFLICIGLFNQMALNNLLKKVTLPSYTNYFVTIYQLED